jgi:hypothetical protein
LWVKKIFSKKLVFEFQKNMVSESLTKNQYSCHLGKFFFGNVVKIKNKNMGAVNMERAI